MKKYIISILLFCLSLSLCGCGMSENQQSFLEAAAELDGPQADIMQDAAVILERYDVLDEEERADEKIVAALDTLVTKLNGELDDMTSLEMTLALDSRISSIEEIAEILPEEATESFDTDKLSKLQDDFFDFFTEEYGRYTDMVVELSR